MKRTRLVIITLCFLACCFPVHAQRQLGYEGPFKPLLPSGSLDLFKRSAMYMPVGSSPVWFSASLRGHLYYSGTTILDKSLNIIHQVPSNVSYQIYEDGKSINAMSTGEDYYQSIIIDRNGEKVMIPQRSDIYPEFGLYTVANQKTHDVYSFEDGTHLFSIPKQMPNTGYLYFLSKDVIVNYDYKHCEIYDFGGKKLFSDVDSFDSFDCAYKGILLSKECFVNTNTNQIYKFSDIVNTKFFTTYSINDENIQYYRMISANDKQGNAVSFEINYVSFDGALTSTKTVGSLETKSSFPTPVGVIGNYFIIKDMPLPQTIGSKLVCYDISKNRKVWEWKPEMPEIFFNPANILLFDDNGPKMTLCLENGFTMIDVTNGKVVKEFISPYRCKTSQLGQSLFMDYPASSSSKSKKTVTIDKDLKTKDLGYTAPYDYTASYDGVLLRLAVNNTGFNAFELDWSLFSLKTGNLLRVFRRSFVDILEPKEGNIFKTKKLVVMGLDCSISILNLADNTMMAVRDACRCDNKLYETIGDCKIFGERAYLFFSYPAVDGAFELATVDVNIGMQVKSDRISLLTESILFVGDGVLVTDNGIKWLDTGKETYLGYESMYVDGCSVYACRMGDLFFTDLGSGKQKTLAHDFRATIEYAKMDVLFTNMGAIQCNGRLLQNSIDVRSWLCNDDWDNFYGVCNGHFVKYSTCPTYFLNKDYKNQFKISSSGKDFSYQMFMADINSSKMPDWIPLKKVDRADSEGRFQIPKTNGNIFLVVISNGLLDTTKSNPEKIGNMPKPVYEGSPVTVDWQTSVSVTFWKN